MFECSSSISNLTNSNCIGNYLINPLTPFFTILFVILMMTILGFSYKYFKKNTKQKDGEGK